MQLPDFFGEVPGLLVWDPLAECLGAAEDGRLHFGYADAMRLPVPDLRRDDATCGITLEAHAPCGLPHWLAGIGP